MYNEDDEEYKKRLERSKRLANDYITSNNSNINNYSDNIFADNNYIDRLARSKELADSYITTNNSNINSTRNLSEKLLNNTTNLNKNETNNMDNNTTTKKETTKVFGTTNGGAVASIVGNLSKELSNNTNNSNTEKNTTKNDNVPSMTPEEIKELSKKAESKNVQPVSNNTKSSNNFAIKSSNIPTQNQLNDEKFLQNFREMVDDEARAKKEAEERNKNIAKGGADAVNEYISTVLKNIQWGALKAPQGLYDVATTLTALGISGLEGSSKIVGLENTAKNLNDAYNSVVNSGSKVKAIADYESKVTNNIDNDFVRTSGEIADVISNMVGNYAIGYIGNVPSTVVQGVSVGGSSSQEILDENKNNIKQATITGIAKGTVSTLTEKMFDANIITRGEKTSLSKSVDKWISRKLQSDFGKEFANKTIGVLGENIEELVEDNVGNLIDKLVNNKETPDFLSKEWWANTSETAKITTLSTIVMSFLGLGGETFENKEKDMQADYWIKQAQQIIEQEDMAIHYNTDVMKKISNLENFYITNFDPDGNISQIIPTIGKPIENPNKDLNIEPVIVKDQDTHYYMVIDGNTGVVLDSTYYDTYLEAEKSFNEKASNLTELRTKAINDKINESNYLITNEIMNIVNQAQDQISIIDNYNIENNKNAKQQFEDIKELNNQISDKSIYNNTAAINVFKTVSNNIKNIRVVEQSGNTFVNSLDKDGKVTYKQKIASPLYSGAKIKTIINNAINNADLSDINISDSTNIDSTQTHINKNTGNLTSNETSYTPEKVKSIIEPFSNQEEYTVEEMANIWNNEIDKEDLQSVYDDKGNLQGYVSIQEDGDQLVVNSYDSNDNIISSEVIPPQNGKYTSKSIKETIEKVTGLYEQNKTSGTSVSKTNNRENAKTNYTGNSALTFEEQVDKWKNGEFSPNAHLTVLKEMPQLYQNMGISNLPITVTANKINRIYYKQGTKKGKYHGLGESVKQLPDAIENPLNIVESITDSNSIVIITELADSDENIVVVSLKLNGNGQVEINNVNKNIDANVLTSAYGRENYDYPVNPTNTSYRGWMQDNFDNNRIIYDIDEGIKKRLINGQWLSLPNSNNKSLTTNNNGSSIDTSISQKDTNVKSDTAINNKSMQVDKNYTPDSNIKSMKKNANGMETDNQGRQLSKQQQEFFKDSKVRDENDNLLTVYHGSNNEFTIFNIKKAGKSNENASIGFWFTTDKTGAKEFAKNSWYGDKNSKVYEGYLNLKNPKIFNSIDNTHELENINNQLKKINKAKEDIIWKDVYAFEEYNINKYTDEYKLNEIIKSAYPNNLEKQNQLKNLATEYIKLDKKYQALEKEYDNKKYGDSYEQFRTEIYKLANKDAEFANVGGTGMFIENHKELVEQYRQKLLQEGYDGIIIKNTKYDNGTFERNKSVNTQYIAFNSNQFKNIDNTTPTLNDDIRYMKTNKTQNVKNEEVHFNKRTAQSKATETTQRNAERQGAYIEEEIKKIEATGNWDYSIPKTSLTDIRKTIENYLGLGIKKGHFRQQAYAIYKGNRDVIRTKEYKDMDSILHETGHALDIGNRLKIDKETISEELLTAIDKLGGYENETRTVRLEEGFAEVIREYSIIPNQAKIDYPQSIAILEKLRQNDKSFNTFIEKVQQQTYNYIHQDPRNRTLSNISIGEQTDKIPFSKEIIKEEFIRKVWDKDYLIKSAVSTLQKTTGKTVNQLKAADNAYYLTRLMNGIGDKVSSMLADGYIDESGNKLMPGLNQIGEILNNNSSRFDDLRVYLVARRDTDYRNKALKTGLRNNDSLAVIEQFKNDKQIQKATQLIYDTLDGVMKYAVNNGLITQETANTLKESNAFYVPMQRVLENRSNQVGRKGTVAEIIKKRVGSELDIKDVLENIIANSTNIIQQVENNNVLKSLYKQGEASGLTGAIYDVIDTPMTKIGTAKLETWKTELERQGIDTNKLDLEKSIDLFSPNNKVDRQNLITSFIDDSGKRVYLQFNDKILFESFMGLDKNSMSYLLRLSSHMNMPLRYGATMANIGFAIPNMISDTAQATIFSTAGFIPVIDNAIGVLDILAVNNKTVRNFLNQIAPGYADKINNLYTIYQQTGATNATRLSQYRKSTQNIMKDIYGTKSSKNLSINERFRSLKKLLDIMTYIPELSEQSTRFRVFQRNYDYYIKKGNSETDARIMAALESRDATQDFSRSGTVTREINQLIPFSAARVGSIYTFSEKVKANPKQVATRIALLTIIAMGIKALGYDDDEIEEVNQRKKDDNFVLRMGDNIVTIKKPQGILRSMINLAEYIQDLATGHIEEGKEGERLGEWINNAIMDNMPTDEVTGLVPNMVAPLIENAINKDFYYNTDIVKSYDLDLPDSQQYYEYNSQLAILIGQVFNYSPAKIDNLISGYFGSLGTSITNIMDTVMGKIGMIAEKPEMGAESNAIGKRFIININSNSASIDEIYNRKTELTKKKNGETITDEESHELDTITQAISNMSKINKQIKEIKKDLSMSGKQKADKIKLLQEQRTDIARKSLGKNLIHPENENSIESTEFYPTNNSLSKSNYELELNSDMKKEYEKLASEYYNKYAKQGLYNEEKLKDIKSKAKDYAKNELFKKYKNNLVKSK